MDSSEKPPTNAERTGAGSGEPPTIGTESPAVASTRAARRRAPAAVHRSRTLSTLWRIGVTVVGLVVLLAGVIMLLTPGPAFIVIPAGLAILDTEYHWAARALHKAQDAASRAAQKARTKRRR